MDGVSIAASIVGIASAGVQVSIKLVTLATQISTASDRVSAIGNDISLTSGVLHQLGELMTEKTTDDGVSIFSQGGLESTKASATVCERIFLQVEREAKKASEQLRDCKQGRFTGGKIKLSKAEKAKWPFLQPSVDTLRADLREAKGTLMLMLQVTTLALSKRMADLNEATSSSMSEQRDFVRAIIALQQQQQQEKYLELRVKNPDGNLPSRQVTSVTSPTRPGTADRIPNVDVVQSTGNLPISVNASQSQASHAQARTSLYEPPSFTTAMSIRRDMNVKFLKLSSILPGQDPSRDMRISSVPREPFEASNAPSHTIDSENTPHMGDGLSAVRKSTRSISDRSGEENSAQNIDTELNLFLLKPVVKDFFDKVELSWSVQNTKMQPLAIRKQMANHEQEGIPSVIEMLHNLHAYEHAMVDLEISKYPEGSVLSLRRTKTDIQHRDMTFKAIPGLQFVVQHVIRSYANPEPAFQDFGVSGGQMTSTMPQASGIVPQNIASPMADCQVCGTLVSPMLGQGGHLICNACGHHFWKQQQSWGQQQQQHQETLPSFQHTSSWHMQQPSLKKSGRPSTTVRAPPGPVTAAGIQRHQQQLMRMHARATPHNQQQLQQQMEMNRQAQVAFQQQQQMQTQQQELAALPQQQQQYHQTSQMRASSQVAPQQQREEQQLEQRYHPHSLGAQMTYVPVAGAPAPRIAQERTRVFPTQSTSSHQRAPPSSPQQDALILPMILSGGMAGHPIRPPPPATGPPMIQAQQQQPQSYFTPSPHFAHRTQPQFLNHSPPGLPPFQSSPGPTPQQQLLAPQPQPQHHQQQQQPQASSPPSRKRKAPGSAPLADMPPLSSTMHSPRFGERLLTPRPPLQMQQDDDDKAGNEAAKSPVRPSARYRKWSPGLTPLPLSASESEPESEEEYEASGFDASEGDDVDVDVDVDAIVKELLEKYTTLFD